MPYFVAFFVLPGVAFSNSSITSFSFDSDAKRFSPAAIVLGEKFLSTFLKILS